MVVVGGIEFRGMSTIVVNPPAAAAEVAEANPSQAVRPEINLSIFLTKKTMFHPNFETDAYFSSTQKQSRLLKINNSLQIILKFNRTTMHS